MALPAEEEGSGGGAQLVGILQGARSPAGSREFLGSWLPQGVFLPGLISLVMDSGPPGRELALALWVSGV